MQSLQDWMVGEGEDVDEDLSEELDSRVAETFLHLVPIVQNDLSRFDFVFDLLEANLEVRLVQQGFCWSGLLTTGSLSRRLPGMILLLSLSWLIPFDC